MEHGCGWPSLVALLAVALLGAACGGGDDEVATPGFDERGQQRDDSPFELAEPTTTAGPTTIPGGPKLPIPTTPDGDPLDGAEGEGSTPPGGETGSTVVETTTTTIAPTAPQAPDSGSIQNLCGMTSSLASFNTIMTNRSIDVATAVGALVRNMDRYVAISPPLLREQVVYVRDVIVDIVGVISRNGYDVESGPVRQAVNAAANGQAPYANLVTVTNQIGAFERTVC